MKSAHRHQLETNILAQRLDGIITRLRPYASTIVGTLVAVAVIALVWAYVSRTSAARQGEAWDAFHQAVAGGAPDVDQLRQSAEEFANTKMQQLADVTWADGQVWRASRDYLTNRTEATEALNLATSTYQKVLQTSNDERLQNRARLGLARVYEMQNDLDKAREEYLKVTGGYEQYAQLQAERLAEPKTKEAYDWLATAQAPRPRAPAGPGTPGQRPEFSAGDIALPGATPDTGPAGATTDQGDSFENLLRSLELGDASGTADRYETPEEAPPADEEAPSAEVTTDDAPATEDTSATEEAPAAQSEPAAGDASTEENN